VDALRVRGELDASGLRIRYGDWFDKPSGVPARAEIRGQVGAHGLDRAQLSLSLGALRARLEHGGAGAGEWRLRSGWTPVLAWLDHVPAARRSVPEIQGRARLRASKGDGDPTGRLELRDVRIGSDAGVGADWLALDLAPGKVSLAARGLAVGGQRADLAGEAAWRPEGPLRTSFTLAAGELRLEPICDALAPLFATGPPPPRGEEPWRTAVAGMVKLLRRDPRLLPRLQLDPGRLRFAHLVGLGLDSRGAEIDLTLREQTLRIAHRDASNEWRYRVDLGGWMPRIARRP
jgi:hypothetical protein